MSGLALSVVARSPKPWLGSSRLFAARVSALPFKSWRRLPELSELSFPVQLIDPTVLAG